MSVMLCTIGFGQISMNHQFITTGLYNTNPFQMDVNRFELARVSNDQILDLFAINATNYWPSGPTYQLINDGDGTFSSTIFGQTNSLDLAFGHINDDEYIDLATDHYTYLNTGSGYNQIHSQVNNGNPVQLVRLGDYDGNGRDDLLVLTSQPSNTLRFYRNASGNYPTTPDWTYAFPDYENLDVKFFNLGYLFPKDGLEDEFDDIIVANKSTDQILVFQSDGSNGFGTAPAQIISVDEVSDFTCSDLDGDGYNELIISRRADNYNDNNHILIYWNLNGELDPTIATVVSSLEGYMPDHVIVDDIDYDGKPDLIIGFVEGYLAVHYNQGGGMFNDQPDAVNWEWIANYTHITDMQLGDITGFGGKSLFMSFDGTSNHGIWQFESVDEDPIPEPPKYLTINGQVGESPRLNWVHSKESDFQNYQIWRGFGGGLPYSHIATVTGNQYIDNAFTIVDRSQGGFKVKPPGGQVTNLIYYVKAVDHADQTSVESNHAVTYTLLPGGIYKPTAQNSASPVKIFTLNTPYPNPFNPSVTIPFGLPESDIVEFDIYNIQGKLVFSTTQRFDSGWNEFRWSAQDNSGNKLPSGLYICKIVSNNQVKLARLLYTK